jgi:heme A synthase
MRRAARFAWIVLGYNVAVIGWGAYVRATGSGAGCGEHWPLCNGQVLPRSPALATIIEFSHRLTSGIALVTVLTLAAWTFRVCRRGHPARWGAALSLLFIVTEAAVGAGLVLFQLVADNQSMARAMFMAVHLSNTFLLLASLTLTGWWLSNGGRMFGRPRTSALLAVAVGCGGLLISGASGSVAALGDTLFPSADLAGALWADLSATSHLLIRLRIFHPVLAVIVALAIASVAPRLAKGRGEFARRAANMTRSLVVVQVGLGLLNIVLLAPVWLQLLHLLVADGIWIAFVLLSAEALAETSPTIAAAEAA